MTAEITPPNMQTNSLPWYMSAPPRIVLKKSNHIGLITLSSNIHSAIHTASLLLARISARYIYY
jgi:hypothetical protein